MKLKDLQLYEVLDFRPDEGIITFGDQRMIIQGAAAMGLLRKQIVETLGTDRARRLLLRFGYADGYHDAISLRERLKWDNPMDGVAAGTTLHSLEGIVHSVPTRLDYEPESGSFRGELVWRNSYEAEQHVHHLGRSDQTVCWTLVGYASGFFSGCLGRDVYFREVTCAGQGHAECLLTGKDAAGWGDELQSLIVDFQRVDLHEEIERARAAVRRQKHALARRQRLLDAREREIGVVREHVLRHAASHNFIVRSSAMREVLELAARVAPLDTNVLIQGESGTGKEFVARMLHDQSPRAGGRLVSLNCAALTDTLLESELFGHVRGAFTGAVRDKAGLFELAANGTLFLDEIGELAPPLQAKLLRALQEREIRRVGGDRTIRVNARVVAATNRDLKALASSGAFREDLYFRLAAFTIALPPLRERPEDIPALVHEFVRRAAGRLRKDVKNVSAEAMALLTGYSWPGNVRELEHVVERSVILARTRTLGARDLPPEIRDVADPSGASPLNLKTHESRLIREALKRHGGNRRRTAAALNIGTVTLWRKMKQYGISA
ncbi:MAG TPA: sigma-54-dependent Fis family transcriptional regulator [Vicinamibacterales bacterium]|nr:sigma-54-dependent Fis family transcriptional regulator [Vicinamibacterales bacterium]